MVWSRDFLLNRYAGPYEILKSMGLKTLDWDEEDDVYQTCPRVEGETISADLKAFLSLLPQARPDLKMITLCCDVVIPSRGLPPLSLRHTTATKSDGLLSWQNMITFDDHIDYDVVDQNVQEVNELVNLDLYSNSSLGGMMGALNRMNMGEYY
jgi:hypothetical protein